MLSLLLLAPMPLPAQSAASVTSEVRLRVGESAPLGSRDLTVVFERVESDGRCPRGVTCVWEGDAVVRVSVGPPKGSRTELSLHTHADAAQKAEAAGFVLTLVALDPYPEAGKRTEPGDYRLRLTATPARR